jgi:hypothetical protein
VGEWVSERAIAYKCVGYVLTTAIGFILYTLEFDSLYR